MLKFSVATLQKFLSRAFFVSMLGCLLASCGPDNPNLKVLKLNHDANNELIATNDKNSKNEGNALVYQRALDKYIEALGYNPFRPELHLNLGLAFELLQQGENAQKSYKEAELQAQRQGNYKVLFMARFNQAQLLGKTQKIDEALDLYQKCLEIIPSSKEVKTNIELLIQSQQNQKGSDKKDQKDDKDQNKNGQGQKGQDKDKDKKQENKKYQDSPKYKPRPFNGEQLSEGDVKKILGEIKQQESKIRAEYNRKDLKEQPRDKDW